MNAVESIDQPAPSDPITAERLRELYLADVFAYVSRRVPNTEDAEDATAETFQAAFGSMRRQRGTDPRLWLLGIARRKVADVHRKIRRRRERPLSDELPASDATQAVAERTLAAASIRRIVLALPDDQREALLLQHLEGLTVAEIAVVMGRSRGAANSLLERARARAYREGKGYFVEELS